MKILIACEFSGIVREAFRERGHEAYSCDLISSELPGHHIINDVYNVIHNPYSKRPWDMMIAFPPCTHLAVSGARWFKDKRKEQHDALTFVQMLMNAPIERICIENPVSIISSVIRKPDQIIQPWMFGHRETKTTCLWLKNLPNLTPTDIISSDNRRDNLTPSGQNKLGPSPTRWKERSRTYTGIAKAMAEQWG
jgi:hypothetical protein